MAKKINSPTLMTKEQVGDYIKRNVPSFNQEGDVSVSEIGDGNINYVFRITNQSTGASLVLKQADELLRSSGRPLDINRNKIEAEALFTQYELVPDLVPEVLLYDEEMAVMVMEDISLYDNLCYALMEQKIFPNLAQQITSFLVETLGNTSDLVLDKRLKKEKVKQFVNTDMCDISEDLVFTEPYDNYKQRNVITRGNEDFVKGHLYDNKELIAEVASLREQFMNHTQSLIHGDLHSGSIFVTQEGMKVIDPEFAFYGPAGYDIGNVLAHFFIALISNKTKSKNEEFENWVLDTILFIFDHVSLGLKELILTKSSVSLYKHDLFLSRYVNQVMSDALGYAGTEIIRRVVGDSKVKELTSLEVGEDKIKIEQDLINLGIKLIMSRHQMTQGSDLIEAYQEIYA